MGDNTHTPEAPAFVGPPEPIRTRDGEYRIIKPTHDGTDITSHALGTWDCLRCGATTTTGVSATKLREPHQCEGCERQGPFVHRGFDADDDRNPHEFIDPPWHVPAGVDDGAYADLFEDVREFIHTYWDTPEDWLFPGLAALAMTTWLRPNCEFVPHIMVMGKHETGKTRLLQTLSRVSYRGISPVSVTPAALYRIIDTQDVTVFLSEYHDLDYDLRNEVNAVIKGAQKRDEIVLRAEPTNDGYISKAFNIFTHLGIGTQFSPPDDIISRCVVVNTQPATRPIPYTFDAGAARALRDRLLFMRYHLLDSVEWEHAVEDATAFLEAKDIRGRLFEKLQAIVAVAVAWDAVDDIEPFVDEMILRAEAARGDSEDADAIRAIIEVCMDELESVRTLGGADPWDAIRPLQKDIVEVYNTMTERDLSSRKFTEIRKRLGLGSEKGRDGVYLADDELEAKLRRLASENNIGFERASVTRPIREIPEEDQYRKACELCGEVREMTHKHAVEGHHMCGRCADGEADAERGEQ